MARRWRIRFTGARYHVTSRGNGRERIFFSDSDRERFLVQLESALAADQVILYAYCLMANHYHLLVETPHANIQKFMHRLNTAYSTYFRHKNARPGHCFETRYHAKLADGDDYLVRLTRYIHLNPVKLKAMVKKGAEDKRLALDGYRWSSYRGYAGLAGAEEWVDYRWLQMMGRRTTAGNRNAYRRYVEGFLETADERLQAAMAASGYAIGDDEFRAEMEDGLAGARLQKGVTGDIVWPAAKTVDVAEVEGAVARAFGLVVSDLHEHGLHAGAAKALAVELSCQLTGLTQRAIAAHFGFTSESSVGKQRKRLAALVDKQPDLAAQIQDLKNQLSCHAV